MTTVYRRMPVAGVSFLICLGLLALLSGSLFSGPQGEKQADNRAAKLLAEPHETHEGQFFPVPRESMPTSAAYRFTSTGITTVQVNVNAAGENIVGDAANEPSIAVNQNDPAYIAIGWRQFDTIGNSFRQAGYAFTSDSGATWTFPGVIDPGVFRSDPVLDSDSAGNFYYNSLTSSGGDFSCDVYISTDGGATWDNGTFAQGGDKQWMVIDRSQGIGKGNIYAFWTFAFSACSPGFFTRSVNGGMSYEDCIVVPQQPFWGTLAVGPQSELYVSGFGETSFLVAKSLNAGDSSQTVTWDFATAVDLEGEIFAFGGANSPNPSGLHGQTWIAVDHSGGATNGNVYLLCSVDPFTGSDPLDVMFSRSTDGGTTWDPATRINDDIGTNAWQWFGTMSVAPNGRIDVVWLDTRDDPGGINSSLYYSYSSDAGLSWSINERLSDAFDPHVGWPQQQKMGDYFHMVSDNQGAHLAWAGTFNGEQDVYYSYITPGTVGFDDETGVASVPEGFTLLQNYPNPFNPETVISYQLSVVTEIELAVFNTLGQKVKTLVQGRQAAGAHSVVWDGSNDLGRPITSGVYVYRMTANGVGQSRKMVLMR